MVIQIFEKKSDKEINEEKKKKLFDGVSIWTAFYRNNPQRFVREYLNIRLKLYQKILIYAMMHKHHVMYFASRGQGFRFSPV